MPRMAGGDFLRQQFDAFARQAQVAVAQIQKKAMDDPGRVGTVTDREPTVR